MHLNANAFAFDPMSGLYAYAYPPTSLIRACLNKVRTENVEIVLIAPGWPNQE